MLSYSVVPRRTLQEKRKKRTPINSLRQAMERLAQSEAGIDRSRLTGGQLTVEYYTRQPSPGQWVAIGTFAATSDSVLPVLPAMVVGTGTTEYSAIEALRARLITLSPVEEQISEPPYVVDWAMMSEPG